MSAKFARPYAEALLQTAPSAFDFEEFLAALGTFSNSVASNRNLRSILANPSVALAAKEGIVEALAEKSGLGAVGRRFLQVVLRHRRLLEIHEIASAIREALDTRAGVVPAVVRAAGKLAPEEADRVTAALGEAIGRKIRATFETDSALLAGFVARVGSRIYDASALGALEKFKEEAHGN